MLIYHMVPHACWEAQSPNAPYTADTLATEGFIHCTAEPDVLVKVANSFYRPTTGAWLILAVETEQLDAEVRWEAADGHRFPHVYGPIALEAITGIVPFPRTPEGTFFLPPAFTGG